MTSWARTREVQFIEVSWGFCGVLLCCLVFFLALAHLGIEVDDARDDGYAFPHWGPCGWASLHSAPAYGP
jgi:hypothetical protein